MQSVFASVDVFISSPLRFDFYRCCFCLLQKDGEAVLFDQASVLKLGARRLAKRALCATLPHTGR